MHSNSLPMDSEICTNSNQLVSNLKKEEELFSFHRINSETCSEIQIAVTTWESSTTFEIRFQMISSDERQIVTHYFCMLEREFDCAWCKNQQSKTWRVKLLLLSALSATHVHHLGECEPQSHHLQRERRRKTLS